MSKKVKIALIIAAVAIAAFLVWRWWSNRQSDNGNAVAPGGSTDLNSVAPELVGGSSGPTVGPAVQLPVNITLTEQASSAPKPIDDEDDEKMKPGKRHESPLQRQVMASSGPMGQPGDNEPAGVVVPNSDGTPNTEGGY